VKVLHLTTHLNIGGVTSYISIAGKALSSRGHEICVASSGGEMAERFEAAGIRCFTLPIRTKFEFHPKIFFVALPKLCGLIKKEKFDLIHSHSRVTQVLGSLASRLTGVPMVTTAHGYYKPRFGRKLWGCWGRRVIAISPLVAEELQKSHTVPASKVRVIFNAVDTQEYRKRILEKNPAAVRRDLGIGENTFVIGSVSRLVRDKGHEYLVEAAGKLLKEKKDIFLLIVGDGREKQRLESLMKKNKLNGRAKILTSTPDITGVLSALDLFAHPATFKEGFGLSMLEAMIAKIPVVTTNIWAINSIIRNRVNGFLVEPKKSKELADTITYVMDNAEVAGVIAQNAFEMACRDYSAERFAGEMEAVYSEVLAEKKK
jgi:glycosyltransferase involved in cell wall biosynthesis